MRDGFSRPHSYLGCRSARISGLLSVYLSEALLFMPISYFCNKTLQIPVGKSDLVLIFTV